MYLKAESGFSTHLSDKYYFQVSKYVRYDKISFKIR